MVRILIVDDNEIFLKPMVQLLAAQGHDPQAVPNGKDAKQLLESSSFDVLISDLAMEPIDGMELLGIALEIAPAMPVIMLTAFATFDLALEAVKCGAFDLLTKPFRVNQLAAAIDRALKWKEAIASGQTYPAPDTYKAQALREFLRSHVPSLPEQSSTRREPSP